MTTATMLRCPFLLLLLLLVPHSSESARRSGGVKGVVPHRRKLIEGGGGKKGFDVVHAFEQVVRCVVADWLRAVVRASSRASG